MLLGVFLFFSCNENNSENSDSDVVNNNDSTEVSDEDSMSESEFVKCEKDSDCPDPEAEFCDPYGECQCRRGMDYAYMVRYQGKCMKGDEGNEFFCNSSSISFYIDADVKQQGTVPYIEEKDDVTCRCEIGYYGKHCENKIDYDDILIVSGELFLPEPNCSKNEDCGDGMKCSDKGYCVCDAELDFSDPAFEYYVKDALGRPQDSSLDGEDLVFLRKLIVSGINKIDHGKCFVNLRSLNMNNVPEDFNFEDVSEMSNIQSINILRVQNDKSVDYSPLKKLNKLLFLYLQVNEDNYGFLKEMDSRNSLVSLKIEFLDGFVPENLDFVSGYKNLGQFIIQSFKNDFPKQLDISSLLNNEIIMILKFHLKKTKLTGLKTLSDLKNLIDLEVELYGNDELQKLSEFPICPNIRSLKLAEIFNDVKIVEKFSNVNSLNIITDGAFYNDLSFLEGLENLNFLYYSDMDAFTEIENINYDVIGRMKNLYFLILNPYKNWGMDWIKNNKYLQYVEIVDVTGDIFNNVYKNHYLENGAASSDYFSNLLYLGYYRDRIFHLEEISGIADYCLNGGAVCNKIFRDNFFTYMELRAVGFNLCGNPINKNDKDIETIVENGGVISIGSDWGDACTSYGVSLLKNSRKEKPDFRVKPHSFESPESVLRWK